MSETTKAFSQTFFFRAQSLRRLTTVFPYLLSVQLELPGNGNHTSRSTMALMRLIPRTLTRNESRNPMIGKNKWDAGYVW